MADPSPPLTPEPGDHDPPAADRPGPPDARADAGAAPPPPGDPQTLIMPRQGPSPVAANRPRTPVTELARAAAERAGRPSPWRRAAGARDRDARRDRPAPRLSDRLAALDARILPPLGGLLAAFGRGARRARLVTTLAVVACSVLALVAVYKVTRAAPPPVRSGAPGVPGPVDSTVGVVGGASIPTYLAGANQNLLKARAGSPATWSALVSFSAYLNPSQVANLIHAHDVRVFSVFLRVPVPHKDTPYAQEDVETLPQDILLRMEGLKESDEQQVVNLLALRGMVTGTTSENDNQRQGYEQASALLHVQAIAYAAPATCACVYAAVVQGPVAELAAFARDPLVRAVDPVPVNLTRGAVFSPPVPEQSGVAVPPSPSGP